MKILASEQLKVVEKETINLRGIQMIDLMEIAATAVFERLKTKFEFMRTHFLVFCGTGNNGGDGLALARMLKNSGATVKVYLLESDNYSTDNKTNQNRLNEIGHDIEIINEHSLFEFSKDQIIIDSIFGYGLNRPAEGEIKSIIEQINRSGCTVISIDLPSGMYCDRLNQENDSVVYSNLCLTFDSPKLSMLLPESRYHIDRFECLDIGFDTAAVHRQQSPYHFIDRSMASAFKINRNRFAYKYKFGNLLFVGGSYGKMGAVCLGSRAAMRCGAGVLTTYIPKCGYQMMQTVFPEAMTMTCFAEEKLISFPDVFRFDTIAVGPGMGTDKKTAAAFEQFLAENDLTDKKLLIDADGINLLSANKNLLELLPHKTIITPHDKELQRLIGNWKDSFEKIEKIKLLSNNYQLIVVSKGAFTQVHLPSGEICFNSSGNPGMSTAGSGDVLTGMIAGLLARGHPAEEAALLGVYLHGLSGDLAVETVGEESLIASDLIEWIPIAFKNTFD